MVYGGETSKSIRRPGPGKRSAGGGGSRSHQDAIPDVDGKISYGAVGTSFQNGQDPERTRFSRAWVPKHQTIRHMGPRQGDASINPADVARRRRVLFLAMSWRSGSSARARTPPARPWCRRFAVHGRRVLKKKFPGLEQQRTWTRPRVIPYSTSHPSMETGRQPPHRTAARRVPATSGQGGSCTGCWGGVQLRPHGRARAGHVTSSKARRRTRRGWASRSHGLVGAFTLVIGGQWCREIMYVVVKERNQEIGIKRAAGARRRHIMANSCSRPWRSPCRRARGLAVATLIRGGGRRDPRKGNEAMQYIPQTPSCPGHWPSCA